ncbi:MAG TPA: ATP synthase F1 subunit epsilon [Azospirillaceae bacterium]|nr:ATP synthase F1 subunit epsilon [Azospirillaceae bacterium]
MADKVEFELVSPEKLLFSQPVEMVVVPGGEGYFGVLPGHSPMIATLKPGVIDVYAENASTISQRIFVAGGFAEVTETRCTVLAQEATELSKLDRAKAEADVATLTEQAAAAQSDSERKALETKLAVATAKVEALTAAA